MAKKVKIGTATKMSEYAGRCLQKSFYADIEKKLPAHVYDTGLKNHFGERLVELDGYPSTIYIGFLHIEDSIIRKVELEPNESGVYEINDCKDGEIIQITIKEKE